MVFNAGAQLLKCAEGFKLGDDEIKPVRNYCYLGIEFSLNGSFKRAIDELRKKALRAYFSIRRIVDTRALTTSTLLKLIDSLVKPVATYGCPVRLPSTNTLKTLISPSGIATLPKATSKDTLETTHLRMLKWVLGVHKKTNNNFCYGDTGRMPWTINVLPQCINFYHRASMAVAGNVNTLLHHTFEEQKKLSMTWYHTWTNVINLSSISRPNLGPVQAASEYTKDTFIDHWKTELQLQTKMTFYRSIKAELGEELYLQLQSRSHRVNIARLRSSSHDLLIERGRYTTSRLNKALKACRYCTSEDRDIVAAFEELPYFKETIIESEEHVLTECPGYHNLRSKLSDNLKSLLLLKEYSVIMTSYHLPEFGKFLTDSFYLRNPKKINT